jgi:hypothetical protein
MAKRAVSWSEDWKVSAWRKLISDGGVTTLRLQLQRPAAVRCSFPDTPIQALWVFVYHDREMGGEVF